MSLIRNEQTKLSAAWLNAVSVATIAVGGFAQLAPVFTGASATVSPLKTASFTVIWFVIGIVLHWVARRVLRRLEP